MGLGKIVTTLSLAISLSASFPNNARSQTPITANIISPTKEIDIKKNKGLIKPIGQPNLELDIYVKKGILPNIDIGDVEIRKNSIYASLLWGYYQIMLRQVNDTTFVEELYARDVNKDSTRYEIFTTTKRIDPSTKKEYFTLDSYDVLMGSPRKEKLPLEGKTYYPNYMPAILMLNNFFENKLEDSAKILVLGVPYNFNVHKKTGETLNNRTEIIYYAKMSDLVTRTEDDVFIMDEFLNLFTDREILNSNGKTEVVTNYNKLEAKFEVLNVGPFWDGKYKATGLVRKKE